MTTDQADQADQQQPGQQQQLTLPAVHEAWLPREHSMHRPRHGKRQLTALICAAVFFATPLVALTLGVRPGEFENRALTPFPGLGQGWAFFTQLSPWAVDHLAFREQAVHAADGISRGVFGEPPALGDPGRDQGPVGQQQDGQLPQVTGIPRVIEGKNGWLYLGAEVESRCRQVQSLQTTLTQLRKLRDGVRASGRKLVVVIAPDKATVVPDQLPDDYVGKSCHQRVTDEFWRVVAGEDYVLDLRPALRDWARRIGAPVYGPLDAHWSDEGGVVMARALAEKLRPGITDTWVVNPGPAWQVPADLPPLIGRTGDNDGRFYSVLPDGEREQTRQVPTDFSTPLRLDTASGTGTYGFGVGLLGDSFTIRALRYLAAGFGDMTVLHNNSPSRDGGRAAADMLVDSSVVVLEIAERSLVAGGSAVLNSPGLDTVLGRLAAQPIR